LRLVVGAGPVLDATRDDEAFSTAHFGDPVVKFDTKPTADRSAAYSFPRAPPGYERRLITLSEILPVSAGDKSPLAGPALAYLEAATCAEQYVCDRHPDIVGDNLGTAILAMVEEVPEPAAFVLLGVGFTALGLARRRQISGSVAEHISRERLPV
jgi:PEP-CTERM motif